MEGLGANRTVSNYDDVVVKVGEKYQVYFDDADSWATTKALNDILTGFIHNGHNNSWYYQDGWNRAYKSRFNVTTSPKVVSDNVVMLEGTGGTTKETFGQLALDRYWAAGNPMWHSGGFMNLVHVRYGLEGMSYKKILHNGVDALQEAQQQLTEAEGALVTTPEVASGAQGGNVNTSDKSAGGKIPWPWIIGGSAGVIVLGTAVALLSSPKKSVATNARRSFRRH
jgi:hypothetical protein